MIVNNEEEDNVCLINDQLNERKPKKNAYFYYYIDVFLSAFLFSPVSALYWYGTWSFLDSYLLPSNQLLSSLLSYFTGLFILLPGYLFQLKLQQFYNKNNGLTRQFIIKLLYVYLINFGIVLEWRGCWELCDLVLKLGWKNELSISVIALTYLLITRSFRLIKSSPYILTYDYFDDEYFISKSRFEQLNNLSRYLQYSFDFLLSEIVESFVVIIAWRGLSIVFELFIYPNNSTLFISITASIGYLVYFILILVQFKLFSIFKRFSLIPRLFFEDVLNLIMFLSLILIWEAYWTFCDYVVYYEQYQLEIYGMLHFGSFILILLSNSSVCIIGNGFELKDGEMESEPDVNDSEEQLQQARKKIDCFFELDYISHLLSKTQRLGDGYSRVHQEQQP